MKKVLLLLLAVLLLLVGCKKQLTEKEKAEIFDKVDLILRDQGFYEFRTTGAMIQGNAGTAVFYSTETKDTVYISALDPELYFAYYPNQDKIVLFTAFGENQNTICEQSKQVQGCLEYESELNLIKESYEKQLSDWGITGEELLVYVQMSTKDLRKIPVGLIYPSHIDMEQMIQVHNAFLNNGGYAVLSGQYHAFHYYDDGSVGDTYFWWSEEGVKFRAENTISSGSDKGFWVEEYNATNMILTFSGDYPDCYYDFKTRESDCPRYLTEFEGRTSDHVWFLDEMDYMGLIKEDLLLPYDYVYWMSIYFYSNYSYTIK